MPFVEGKPFAEVLKRAKAEGKPVMLDVVAAWCGPCKIMDRTTFADAGVVAWAKKAVVPARVDAEKGEGRKISARYQAYSFPTVVFLDGDGNEIDRLVGGFRPRTSCTAARPILAGKTPLLEGLARLKAKWNREEALRLGGALASRRDRARLRPIALRVVSEEGDLSRPEVFQLFAQLVAIETLDEDFSPETGDLIATFLPRLGTDPRRGLLRGRVHHGARQARRRRDGADGRAETLAAVGEGGPYTADVLAALGGAEKKAGHTAEALAACERAAAAALRTGPPRACASSASSTSPRPHAAAGRPAEAKKAWTSAARARRPARWTAPSRRAPPAPPSRSRSPPRRSSTPGARWSSHRARTRPRRRRSRRPSAPAATRPARRGRLEARRRARAAERRVPRRRRGRRPEEGREGLLSLRGRACARSRGSSSRPSASRPSPPRPRRSTRPSTTAAGRAGVVETLVHDGDPEEPARLVTLFASPGRPDTRGTLLFLHGKGGGGAEWTKDAVRALRLGFNVLVPELRGHPPSTGARITYGIRETNDLLLLLDLVRERFGVEAARLGIDGCSMGSLLALQLAAARTPAALWLQSPFGDLRAMAVHYLHRATGLPRVLLEGPVRLLVRRIERTERLDLSAGRPRGRGPARDVPGDGRPRRDGRARADPLLAAPLRGARGPEDVLARARVRTLPPRGRAAGRPARRSTSGAGRSSSCRTPRELPAPSGTVALRELGEARGEDAGGRSEPHEERQRRHAVEPAPRLRTRGSSFGTRSIGPIRARRSIISGVTTKSDAAAATAATARKRSA